MSYLVLARKWRPKNFADTVGQEHVLRALANALDSGRLHHAYLFAGTRGVGKTTIARILAKALNCESGVTSQPCGECTACREIDEGRFVDLIEVDAASKTKVDDTRDLLDNVPFAPARGRYKVYLIDEVHMLSRNSFNALLKTLEEPPPHVKFLLATTDPQKVPVTVLSRCLQFNLKRLSPMLIRERLELICKEEKVDTDTSALALIARAADGSLRDALSLLDQAIAYCSGQLTKEPVAEMLGTIDRQHVSRILGLLASADAPGLITAIREIDEQFPDYETLLDDLARLLQRIAVYQVVGAADIDDEDEEKELAAFAAELAPEDVQLFYQIALIGRRDLHLAPDPRSGAEMTLLRMLAFRPADSDGVAVSGRKFAAAPSAPKSSESKAVDWQDPDWSVLVASMELSGAAKMLAKNCAFLRREGKVVYLRLDAKSESFLTKSAESALKEALGRYSGEPLRVDISIGDTETVTPAQQEARQIDERYEAARASIEADPNVKALKDMFGAEINPDSIEPVRSQSQANQE
ncbi:MAG: DNA polymerase III subunit gamma/tau [Woeseiaceae bacterium]|nr:DNA polymerase III subunit gamma/tau [Woeseiaceae bacterium]